MAGEKKHLLSRMLRLGLVLAIQCLYIPLNRGMSGGVLSRIRLDDFIPLVPAWTVIYLLWLPVSLGLAVWAAVKMPEGLFRAYFFAGLATISASMLVFFLFPTYVSRPEVQGGDFFSTLLRVVYQNDRLYNANPSGHVYLAVLTAFFYLCWQSGPAWSLRSVRWGSWRPWVWVAMVVTVSLSTVFTGQHSLIDIPGGFLAAVAGFYTGWWWARRSNKAGENEP